MNDPVSTLLGLFETVVHAASSFERVVDDLPDSVKGRVLVLGFGKASGALAAAVEPELLRRFGADRVSGWVALPDGSPDPGLARLELVRASHPRPDRRSLAAAERALHDAVDLKAGDLLLALVSGGGSSLLCAPARGITFEDKLAAVSTLLNAGAPIAVLNAARKRLSAVKGGRLAAAAAPARVLNLVVSDIPGDDPALVASGPTTPDLRSNASVEAAMRTLARGLPEAVRERILDASEALLADDRRLPTIETRLVSRPSDALEAAEAQARAYGWDVLSLGADVQGDARAVAQDHAGLIRLKREGPRSGRPFLLLSGGETTAEVRGGGRGGRNTEYLLALALELQGEPELWSLAADTDGVDGTGPHAGAFLDPQTLDRARAAGVDPVQSLVTSDSLSVFDASGGVFVTGPTGANANDFRATLLL